MRVRIVGVSGSGKSCLAERLSRSLGLPRLELDAVFWAENWTHRDLGEARTIVREFAAANREGWVVDGDWASRLGGLLDPGTPDGADLVVWLDHPRSLVMARLLRRTLARGLLHRELWHGNRERPSSWLRRDPEENILVWAWMRHPIVRERMEARIAAGEPIVRLAGRGEANRWVAGVTR